MSLCLISQPRFLSVGLLLLLPTGLCAQPPAPPDTLATSLSRIDSLRMQGQFQTALTHLDRLAPSRTDRIEVLWRRALMLTDLARDNRETAPEDTTVARHRRALTLADSALAVDSTHAWAHLVKALSAGRLTLHVGSGDRVRYSRAVKRHADRAIELDSTLAAAYHLRGRWNREVANLNLIKRALVKAIYGGLPDASYEQAIADFKQAIALESKPYNHLELGKTYLKVDRPGDAREQLKKALTTSGSPFQDEHKEEARALLDEMK